MFFFSDTTIFIPSFNGTSYLELPPLGSLLQSPGASADPSHPAKDTTVTLYLTVKTRATQGTILYSKYKHGIPLLFPLFNQEITSFYKGELRTT